MLQYNQIECYKIKNCSNHYFCIAIIMIMSRSVDHEKYTDLDILQSGGGITAMAIYVEMEYNPKFLWTFDKFFSGITSA